MPKLCKKSSHTSDDAVLNHFNQSCNSRWLFFFINDGSNQQMIPSGLSGEGARFM